MPAIDICEPQVLRALQKEMWTVTQNPFTIRTKARTVFADCLLERHVSEVEEQIIVIEVKCFSNPSNDLTELYTALGQYLYYRAALLLTADSTRIVPPVFLAIPEVAYGRLTKDEIVNIATQQNGIKLVVINIESEEVVEWIH